MIYQRATNTLPLWILWLHKFVLTKVLSWAITPGARQTRFPALPYTPIWTWTQLLIEHNGNAISFIQFLLSHLTQFLLSIHFGLCPPIWTLILLVSLHRGGTLAPSTMAAPLISFVPSLPEAPTALDLVLRHCSRSRHQQLLMLFLDQWTHRCLGGALEPLSPPSGGIFDPSPRPIR